MTGPDKLSQLQTQIDRLLEQQLASLSEIRRLQQELQELHAENQRRSRRRGLLFFMK